MKAICIHGILRKPLDLSSFPQDVDIFLCTNNDKFADNPRLTDVKIVHGYSKLDMIEQVAWLKRCHEINNVMEYSEVYMCSPKFLHVVDPTPITHGTIRTHVHDNMNLPVRFIRALNHNAFRSSSLTCDIVSTYNQFKRGLNFNFWENNYVMPNKDEIMFYHFVNSLFINYENCDLYKWTS